MMDEELCKKGFELRHEKPVSRFNTIPVNFKQRFIELLKNSQQFNLKKERELLESNTYFRKACKLGNILACTQIINPTNEEKLWTYELLTNDCLKNKNGFSCIDLADALWSEGRKNIASIYLEKGKPLLEEACEKQKNADACFELARRSGDDKTKTLQYLMRACSYGSSGACFIIATQQNNSPETYEKIMTSACFGKDGGSKGACWNLAKYLHFSNQKPDKVMHLLRQACKLGDVEACVHELNFDNLRIPPFTPKEQLRRYLEQYQQSKKMERI